MPREPMDELRQHCEIVCVCLGQREWNMRGHQNAEVGYGTCLNVTLECPSQLERHNLTFSGREQMQI
jgi:hypothetical protein